jgi:hypothetical protein
MTLSRNKHRLAKLVKGFRGIPGVHWGQGSGYELPKRFGLPSITTVIRQQRAARNRKVKITLPKIKGLKED